MSEASTAASYYAIANASATPTPQTPLTTHKNQPSPEKLSEKKVMSAVDEFLASYHLSSFSKQIALQWLKTLATDSTQDLARVKGWLMRKMNHVRSRPELADEWQKGCPELIPGLRSRAFWDTKEFEWIPRVSLGGEGCGVIIGRRYPRQSEGRLALAPWLTMRRLSF